MQSPGPLGRAAPARHGETHTRDQQRPEQGDPRGGHRQMLHHLRAGST